MVEKPDWSKKARTPEERRRASAQIYFKSEDEKRYWVQLSEKQGYTTFSPWVVQMLYNATTGTAHEAAYVDNLIKDVQKYRGWLEQKDAEIAELRRTLRVCEQQREDLRVVVASVTQDASAARARLQGPEVS